MDSSAVPKVSVIIPLYNKAPYIKRALDSVFAQTVQDFEVIVVNDGSKDGGEKIVEEYGDSRIHLINQENQGVSAARNHGVDAALAELVAFLDADDEWLPEFLETILRLREKWPDAGMYTTTWYSCNDKYGVTNIRKTPKLPKCWEGKLPSTLKSAAYAQDNSFPGCASSTAVPKRILGVVGGFNEGATMWEDPDLWARIALFYPSAHSTIPHVIYHHNETSVTATYNKTWGERDPPFIESYNYICNNQDRFPDYYEDKQQISQYIDRVYINMAILELRLKNKINARHNIIKINNRPFTLEKVMYYLISYLPRLLIPLSLKIIVVINTPAIILIRYLHKLLLIKHQS